MLHSLTHEDHFFFLQCTASTPLFRFFHFSGLAEPSSGLSFHWANLRDMGHNNAINTIILYYVLIHTVIRGLVRILWRVRYVEFYTKFLQSGLVSFLFVLLRHSSRPSSLLTSPLDTASKSFLRSNLSC